VTVGEATTLKGFQHWITDVLEEPLTRAEEDGNDMEVKLVELPSARYCRTVLAPLTMATSRWPAADRARSSADSAPSVSAGC
jgi:hypothetical protein